MSTCKPLEDDSLKSTFAGDSATTGSVLSSGDPSDEYCPPSPCSPPASPFDRSRSTPSVNDRQIRPKLNTISLTQSVYDHWVPNTDNCQLCGLSFGLRSARHHCRICGKNVCRFCSPNRVQIDGHEKLQRACTPCVSSASQAGHIITSMCHRLNTLLPAESFALVMPDTASEAIDLLKSIVSRLERHDTEQKEWAADQSHRINQATIDALAKTSKVNSLTGELSDLQKDMKRTRCHLADIAAQLQSSSADSGSLAAVSEDARLEDMALFCKAALGMMDRSECKISNP